jgi:hypothetical protein
MIQKTDFGDSSTSIILPRDEIHKTEAEKQVSNS